MVPIFAFISPTFIYSFLEEKVQSSYNYLICVDFPLYAREINTEEISSVVLVCKCHLKIQPDYQPRSLSACRLCGSKYMSHPMRQEESLLTRCMGETEARGGWMMQLKLRWLICALLWGQAPRSAWFPGTALASWLDFPLPGCNICWGTNNAKDRLSARSSADALK